MDRGCVTCKIGDMRIDGYLFKNCYPFDELPKWESKEGHMFNGVEDNEIVTNAQGGKQSKLDYRFDLIDAKAMFALAKVMHEGAQKYDVDNWRKISVDEHLNHAESHIWAHRAGDKQDFHLSHAFTRTMMAL